MKRILIQLAFLMSLALAADAQVQQVTIDFDELPAGTVVRDQYPNTMFSCDPGYEPRVGDAASNCSLPNTMAPGIIDGPFDPDRPLYLDFVIPVNNLTLCVDNVFVNTGGIIRVFENGSLSEEVGYSCSWVGCPIDLTNFYEVTRIELVPIVLGATWDSFSFTYQDSSPIPALNEVGVSVFAVLLAAAGAAFLWWRNNHKGHCPARRLRVAIRKIENRICRNGLLRPD